ncbi:hypothetical protein [Pleomorphovibrio marinus]|uniref:hypothetical protein n=1 Tax=Pleomorphovibrio marinus TaxID=2164132 RepID=UPI000E0CA074|nr:hypothetical protein [Pleomorphovibrio marinus]
MHIKSEDIIRLEIEFHSGEIPAPYSHQFKIKLVFGKNFINTQFDINYLDREELSEEEILNEGFSLNDDFSFVGELPKIWEPVLKNLYSNSKWSHQKMLDDQGGIKVLAKDKHGKIVRSIALNPKEWHYYSQELIQAIYEISKKEAPLQIRYKQVTHNKTMLYELTFKFATRKFVFCCNGAEQILEWQEAKDLLACIFLPDYDYGTATSSEPTKEGNYIDCGDGFWHEFGEGLINLDEGFDAKKKIQEEFERLSQLLP